MSRIGICLTFVIGATLFFPAKTPAAVEDRPPMSVEEGRDFMRRLATYVRDHHLKKDDKSPQRGLIYEYLDVTRIGKPDQFVEGEALDTMHDGSWFAAAMVNASRAGDERLFREILVGYQLPFYCKMLNHSDELFSAKRNDARPTAPPFGREHMLIEGEKGFVPYFWDDGNSVSLERRRDRNPLGIAPCRDNLAGKPNPLFALDGYSLGCSNHMAQDLGVMLQQSWLLLRNSNEPADKTLLAEISEGAKNLQASRMHHHGHIPMCDAPAALAANDATLMRQVP
ncbi:MAG TPA: hypothetical protein VLJ39_12905, partial [Tepidisphaeraceae bacterium]|nr:hypothetical protein [Tepidisphaeraceae bacterium]